MNLLVYDEEFQGKQDEIWDKVKDLIKKQFESEQVYNDKYIKTKMKLYNNKMYTSFQSNKIQKDDELYLFIFNIIRFYFC